MAIHWLWKTVNVCASSGVDTPETKHPTSPVEHFGKEAAAFTRRMVEGKRVRLEFDPVNAVRAHKDSTQQRRTLAYVFLEDGTLLNAEIIKQGLWVRLHSLSVCAGRRV